MADTGYGIVLDGATTGTIGEVLSLSTDVSADVIDTSSADSPDSWREKMPGMQDAGEITFEINRDGASGEEESDLNSNFGAAKEEWTVTFSDGSTFVCDGFISSLSASSSYDDKETTSVTITLTGKPVFVDVAAA